MPKLGVNRNAIPPRRSAPTSVCASERSASVTSAVDPHVGDEERRPAGDVRLQLPEREGGTREERRPQHDAVPRRGSPRGACRSPTCFRPSARSTRRPGRCPARATEARNQYPKRPPPVPDRLELDRVVHRRSTPEFDVGVLGEGPAAVEFQEPLGRRRSRRDRSDREHRQGSPEPDPRCVHVLLPSSRRHCCSRGTAVRALAGARRAPARRAADDVVVTLMPLRATGSPAVPAGSGHPAAVRASFQPGTACARRPGPVGWQRDERATDHGAGGVAG